MLGFEFLKSDLCSSSYGLFTLNSLVEARPVGSARLDLSGWVRLAGFARMGQPDWVCLVGFVGLGMPGWVNRSGSVRLVFSAGSVRLRSCMTFVRLYFWYS